MMKKTYVKAAISVCKIEACSLLAGSDELKGKTPGLTEEDDVVNWDNQTSED